MPTSGISRRVSAISRFMSSMLTGQAHSGSGSCGRRRIPSTPVRQYYARGLLGDLRRLLAVVALVGHEVLQDHLLDVPVLGVHRRERLQRFDPLLLALADADEDAPT